MQQAGRRAAAEVARRKRNVEDERGRTARNERQHISRRGAARTIVRGVTKHVTE